MPTSKHIGFCPLQARVTGGDVLGALERLAGENLINRNRSTCAAMEAILSRICSIEQTGAQCDGD